MKFLKPAKDNREARMNFVNYWAEFVKTHPDKEWSAQQNKLINSMLQSAKANPLTPRQYLELKGEVVGGGR